MIVNRFIFTSFLCFILFFVACSGAFIKQVPLSTKLSIVGLGKIEPIHKTILLGINEELKNKVIINKPIRMKGAFSYQLRVGEAITMNLMSFMKVIFDDVSLPSSGQNRRKYDYLLRVEMVRCDIKQGLSLGSQHEISLVMRFFLYDTRDRLLTDFLVVGEGTNEMTNSEIVNHLLVPGADWKQEGYLKSIGRAWDIALTNLIRNLMLRISNFFATNINSNNSHKLKLSLSGIVIQKLDDTTDKAKDCNTTDKDCQEIPINNK